MKGRFLQKCLKKLKNSSIGSPSEKCLKWGWWARARSPIPSDVPKGHSVVYVGENHKRYVIKVSCLNHPLFVALLDQTSNGFGASDFTTADSKFWIPCDEKLFVRVVRHATPPPSRRAICIF
ncbi:hypothetical protein DM860_001176 [Cuscuta australis]|uniref:Auxin-responsive protein n=1 Tax=Cuscuta australis TaxID=267555 RepID=A0A328DU69_9ASTE|nr:hypothetical protein DM860_001176 [Cuscuta australis]